MFKENFQVYNMVGRPVFVRPITELDIHIRGLPILCDDCREGARYIVFELNGERWAWCGECDQGG